MELIKRDIIDEVNENVNNKFEILDRRLDRLFQKIPNNPPIEDTNDENHIGQDAVNINEKNAILQEY